MRPRRYWGLDQNDESVSIMVAGTVKLSSVVYSFMILRSISPSKSHVSRMEQHQDSLIHSFIDSSYYKMGQIICG